MERKLSKKAKIFLSIASAITANTAVATLLTSCSFSNKINDIGGFDNQYGINNATYARMEEDFEMLYKSQLDQRKDSGEINDDTYDSNLYAFKNNLNSLHTSLYSGENKTLSYTIKTNVLRDYARDNYGIRLSRQSSVILDEAIKDIRSSILSSVLLMCKEYGITDTSEYYKNVDTEFEKLENEAKAKYGDADVVSIIQYIQSGMTTCFNGICDELDCLATQQQLKKFIEKYSISVKESIADDYCWDRLFSKYGEGNKEISAEDFNNIFEISCEDSDPQKVYGSYISTSKKTEKFKNDIIPGYILKPILVKMNGDPYTNTYSIDVDYTLVNERHKDKVNVAELTAHSSALKNKSLYGDENKSIFDLNASDEQREYTNYVLPITKEYEEKQINDAYFGNENFEFSWSTSDEYGYDDFWTEANENGEYKSKLNVSSLATTGMMINGVLLSEILSQAGKISLSGGSYELNGFEKSEDSDTKQWKLIVDNNEIKSKDIRWELISATTTELPNSIFITTNGVVSWTNQIVAGTYQFCILANYKETKIQSAPITLTISSKDAKNIENFNHNIKSTLFDENTIDQKLLDFVNNVNFNLDYTEFDYDAPIDNKLGEIKVIDFIISYKNSDNTFKASESINEVISNAINSDSTITSRYSNNLYYNLEHNYQVAILIKTCNNVFLFNKITSMSEHVNNMYIAGRVIFSTCTVLEAIFAICLITIAAKHSTHGILTKQMVPAVICLLLMFIPLGYFFPLQNEVCEYINNSLKWCKSSSQDDKSRTDFESKLIDGAKYFFSSNGKDKFDQLSNKEIRSLAYFYTNFYIRPADYNKSDEKFAKTPYRMYDQYIEFNYELEKATKHLFGVLISGLVLASISLVVSLTIFCICISNLKNQGNHIGNTQQAANSIMNQGNIINNNNNNIVVNNVRGKGGPIDQTYGMIDMITYGDNVRTNNDITWVTLDFDKCEKFGINKLSDLEFLKKNRLINKPSFFDHNIYEFWGVSNNFGEYIATFRRLK